MTKEQEERLEEIKNFVYEVRMLDITSKDVQFVVNNEFLLNLIQEQQAEIEKKDNIIEDLEEKILIEGYFRNNKN